MDFTLPATKSEMYDTLQEIFHYYRIARSGYSPIVMTPLNISQITFTPMTSNELTQKASTLLSASWEQRKLKRKTEINSKIESNTNEISAVCDKYTESVETLTQIYSDSEDKIRNEAVKNGLGNSSIVLDKIAQLETEKNTALAKLLSEKNGKVSSLTSENAALSDELSDLDTAYQTLESYESAEKISELKDAENKLAFEYAKYNNSITEKIQRNANTVAEVNATLLIKYLEIQSAHFTKDQLVDMGYYTDVIECVTGYYDTMSASSAYNDIVHESKLTTYLDDYYESVIYMYKTRAGV